MKDVKTPPIKNPLLIIKKEKREKEEARKLGLSHAEYKSRIKRLAKEKEEEIKKEEEEKKKRKKEIQDENIAAKARIICPHCHTKGQVRQQSATEERETRQKGFIGAIFGQRTIENLNVRELHCSACQTTWSI